MNKEETDMKTISSKNILLKIVENNGREHESWFFILDLQKHDLGLVNRLMDFIQVINKNNQKVREDYINSDLRKSLQNSGNMFYRPRPTVAVSRYSVTLKNEIKEFGETSYMEKYNYMNTQISKRKLDIIINKYRKDKDKNDPFYKGGIINIFYKNK